MSARYLTLVMLMISMNGMAQDDLLSDLLGEKDTNKVVYTTASFKTTRVVNLHSLENTKSHELDVKISHRFTELSNGFYDLFGLDAATIRIGADYGVTDRFMIGMGRSTIEKTYDGFLKYKLLRQSTGAKKMPITMALFTSMAINTIRGQFERSIHRYSYVYQIHMGRKFNEIFTLQISPSLVHRNFVDTSIYKNDVFAIGIGSRLKLTKRTTFNTEYIYRITKATNPIFINSFSVGFDIETGGHVFQLHFTNSNSMIEKGFITQTTGDFFNGDIHFGFNIARVFTIGAGKSTEW